MDHNNRMVSRIENYISECETKSLYHKQNASNALKWFNFTGILGVVISAGQALTMLIESSVETDATIIAITGGCYAFVLAIFARVQTSFSFNTISLEHNHLSDNFVELHQNFQLLLNDIEAQRFDENIYNLYVNRYISVNEKHVPEIPDCFLLSCCC